jgi:hypothetical protein
MEHQNYYLLLELPYDPPEHNYETIKKAIQKKRSLWSRRLSNAKYRSQAEGFLNKISQMEKDLEDHAFRENEAREAKELKEKEKRQQEKEKFEKLDEIILILSKKGYLTDVEISGIENELGFTAAEINIKIANIRIEKSQEGSGRAQDRQTLTKEKMKSISDLIDSMISEPRLGSIPTLYDLLGLPESANEKELHEKASMEYKALSIKGAVQGELVIKKDAFSQAMTVFKQKETRMRYDESLSQKRFEKVYQYIKIAGCTGRMEKSVFEEIRNLAVGEGLSEGDAERRIKAVCQMENIIIGPKEEKGPAKNEYRQCGFCGQINKPQGHSCTKCGESLTVSCRKCKATFPSSDKHCSSCGTSHIALFYQDRYIQRAEWHLLNKDYDSAEEMVEKAKHYWAEREGIHELSEKIRHARRYAQQQLKAVNDLMDERKYYSAKKKLAVLKRETPFLPGIQELESVIKRQITSAEALLDKAKVVSGDKQKMAVLLEALEECSDCGAAADLKKFPPEPPSDVRARIAKETIKLEWASPYEKEDVIYEIYRLQESLQAVKIAETSDKSFTDKKTDAGIRYSYYIITRRGGKVSAKSIMSANLMRTSDVDDLRARISEQGIKLSWNPAGKARIEVWRKEGSLPEKRGDGTKLSGVKQAEVLDNTIEKNKQYGYLVLVQYEDALGRPFFSEGTGLMAVHPTGLAGEIRVDEQRESILFNWEPPQVGEVKIFYSPFPFTKYKKDECWSYLSILKEEGNELVDEVTNGSASKSRDFSGILHVMPVLKLGGCAIIGDSFVLKSVQPVSSIIGQREQSDLILQWNWPEEAQKVTVRYSNKGFEDAGAEERECSKFSYEKFNGYRVDSINEKDDLFITISTTEEWEGEKIHSKPVRYLFTEKEPIEIRYSMSITRKILSLKKEASIKIKLPEQGIPNLALVKQKGRIPNRKSDGEIIKRIDASGAGSEEYITISLNDHLEAECYAKLFFELKEDARNYKIVAESGTKFELFT